MTTESDTPMGAIAALRYVMGPSKILANQPNWEAITDEWNSIVTMRDKRIIELELALSLALRTRSEEIESLRARNDELDDDLINERILHYAAEAERNATMLVVEGAACIDEFGLDAGCRSRLAIEARAVLQHRENGPDFEDGHDCEGFIGGCERFGCAGGDQCTETVRQVAERKAKALIEKMEWRDQAINEETERCAKIASEFTMSPVVGKAIAALILRGR